MGTWRRAGAAFGHRPDETSLKAAEEWAAHLPDAALAALDGQPRAAGLQRMRCGSLACRQPAGKIGSA